MAEATDTDSAPNAQPQSTQSHAPGTPSVRDLVAQLHAFREQGERTLADLEKLVDAFERPRIRRFDLNAWLRGERPVLNKAPPWNSAELVGLLGDLRDDIAIAERVAPGSELVDRLKHRRRLAAALAEDYGDDADALLEWDEAHGDEGVEGLP